MRKSQGFTLIELLIVIAIIGILAAVLIPNLLSARQRANVTAAEAYVRNVAIEVEAARTPLGEAPDPFTCPTAGRPAAVSGCTYTRNVDTFNFTIAASTRATGSVQCVTFDSVTGQVTRSNSACVGSGGGNNND